MKKIIQRYLVLLAFLPVSTFSASRLLAEAPLQLPAKDPSPHCKFKLYINHSCTLQNLVKGAKKARAYGIELDYRRATFDTSGRATVRFHRCPVQAPAFILSRRQGPNRLFRFRGLSICLSQTGSPRAHWIKIRLERCHYHHTY